ncbi:hypothetical protein Q760_08765 [Cellulomonas cellasea DSM 20118]|uniref:Uncharacterized protein n=1 Tax=Cellulomonas cellasea DSM 20118 TaxID=1408250 RepID=A0A0A0B2Y0_9CELL|nr:hypothetical protein Q760_08765 [Cellulomonas cellasea DSM 20118]
MVVGDEQRGRARRGQRGAQVVGEALAQRAVEGRQRLVEQQQPGPRRERTGERDALLLPAGEGRDGAPLVAREPDDRQQLAHAGVPLGAGFAGHPEPELDVAADVAVREELAVLEHQPEPAPVHGHTREVGAVPRDRPGGGRLESRDRAQQRGLAAARRPEQRDDLAGRDPERHAVDGHGRAVARAVAHDEPVDPQAPGTRPAAHSSPPRTDPRSRSASAMIPAVSSASSTDAASAMP